MKRTFADRPNWSRVIDKRFNVDYIENVNYSGFVSIIYIDKVREPLFAEVLGNKLCLADDGYIWTQHFPKESKYALTTMFDSENEIVQWYFDICKGNKINDLGIPYYDDLFLDIVVLPSDEVLLLDEDELNDALCNKVITKDEYDLAYHEAEILIDDIKNNRNILIKNAKVYLEHMLSLEI